MCHFVNGKKDALFYLKFTFTRHASASPSSYAAVAYASAKVAMEAYSVTYTLRHYLL